MNTCSEREKFRNFRILLNSNSSSTIVMDKLTSKLEQKKTPKITTWETQAGKFTTSMKVNIHFCLPEFSATKNVSWKSQVDNSTNIRYNIIVGRDLLTALELYLKSSENIIIIGEVTYKGCSSPMADLSNYDLKP